MSELEWPGEPEIASLRRAVRHRLRRFDPTLRVIAEGFLAESSEIDLLAVGNEGDLVSIRIGRAGSDAALLTRALSDLTWLRSRQSHLLKLAPGLGIEPSAAPRALLLCPDFSSETRSAIAQFPIRRLTLLGYRCLRQQGQLSILLETMKAEPLLSLERSGAGRAPAGVRTGSAPAGQAESVAARRDARKAQPNRPLRPDAGGFEATPPADYLESLPGALWPDRPGRPHRVCSPEPATAPDPFVTRREGRKPDEPFRPQPASAVGDRSATGRPSGFRTGLCDADLEPPAND